MPHCQTLQGIKHFLHTQSQQQHYSGLSYFSDMSSIREKNPSASSLVSDLSRLVTGANDKHTSHVYLIFTVIQLVGVKVGTHTWAGTHT